MSAFSDYYENKILDHMLRGQAFTVPTTVYLALFTANTGLEGNSPSGEVAGGSYSRVAITLGAAASSGSIKNTADINYTTATGAWGTVTSVAVVDHPTNTTWGSNVNVLMWADLSASKTVGSGDTFKILTNDLTLTVA